MSKITFGYIVGGEDKHYNNLLRSLESLERIEQPHEVVILDADSRLEADEDKPNVRIIPFPVDEEFDYIKQNLCGNLGWVDVWMPMYYFLSGKQYRHNNLLTETTSNPIWTISKEPIVHQYKVHYE